jgi:hypothetical protein
MARIDSSGATLGLVVGAAVAQIVNVVYMGEAYNLRPYLGIYDIEVAAIIFVVAGALSGLAVSLIVGPLLYLVPALRPLVRSIYVMVAASALAALLPAFADLLPDRRAYFIVTVSTVVVAIPVAWATTSIRAHLARREERFLLNAGGRRDEEYEI